MKAAAEISVNSYRDEARESLAKSRRYYYRAFRKDRQPWALVQALVLTAVLRYWNRREQIQRDEWELARILSTEELKSKDRQWVTWANANLMELYLLAPSLGSELGISAKEARDRAAQYVQDFNRATDQDQIEVYSTRRQLLRYPGFFARVNPELTKVAEHAAQLALLLPESRTFG